MKFIANFVVQFHAVIPIDVVMVVTLMVGHTVSWKNEEKIALWATVTFQILKQ